MDSGKLIFLVVALCSLAFASPALAGHQKGGSIDARITADGRLTGRLTYMYSGGCTVGDETSRSVSVVGPDSTVQSVTASGTMTRCLGDALAVATTTFDADLNALFGADGSAPDGDYVVYFSSCCRIEGIVNFAGEDTYFEARVRKSGSTPAASPQMNSDVATGIAKGYEYRQSLNASDPDGGTLAYTSLAGTQNGPTSDVIDLSDDGVVSIPADTTSSMSDGAAYVYKVRATDAEGNYAERDVLLTVTGNNVPPELGGLPTGAVNVTPGRTTRVAFTASDANNSSPKIDTVSVSASGLPEWAQLSGEPGNPAAYTLTLSPPADLAPQDLAINLDAVDDDPESPLTASANLNIRVAADTTAPPVPILVSAPAERASVTAIEFADGEAGAQMECSVDDGEWADCVSPFAPSLGDGQHTVAIRAYDDAGNRSDAVTHTWVLDTSADVPEIASKPADGTTSTEATFEFTGEPGSTMSCRIDGGDWQPCASPLLLTDQPVGQHSLEVKQVDLAGNESKAAVATWTVEKTPPAPQPEPQKQPDSPEPPKQRDPEPLKVNVVVNANVAVQASAATVGCEVNGAALRRCDIEAYLLDRRSAPGGLEAKASRRIKVGTGRLVTTDDQTSRVAVKLRLNRTGRRLLKNAVGGLRVRFDVAATAITGAVARGSAAVNLVAERQLIVPSDGMFRTGSARILPGARRTLAVVARRLAGQVRSVSCTGYTDTAGSAAYNYELGLARAKAVCRYLRAHGVKGAKKVASRGEANPRSSNAIPSGRARNRRVELTVAYR